MEEIIWKILADRVANELNVICMIESRKLFLYNKGDHFRFIEIFLKINLLNLQLRI